MYEHGKSLIKIAIADDHELLRNLLCGFINGWDNCKVVIEAANGQELIDKLKQKRNTDLVIIDSQMPVMDGYTAILHIKKEFPDINIMVLSLYGTELAIARMIKAGTNGFITKAAATAPELKKGVHEIMRSGFYFANDTAGKMAKQLFLGNNKISTVQLTDEEINVMKYLCTEMTYKEIAKKLNKTNRHVDYIREGLFTKLNVKSRVALVLYAINSGLS